MAIALRDTLTREDLIKACVAREAVIGALMTVLTHTLAHASHIIQNHAQDAPDEKIRDWSRVYIDATSLQFAVASVSRPAAAAERPCREGVDPASK